LFSILISGCGATGEEALTAEEALAQSFTTMSSLDGFHFLILTEGKEAYLDQQETIVFLEAEGDFAAPDRVAGDIKVKFMTMVAEVSIINIAEMKWETNMLTGAWQESTTDYAFQPLSLLNPDSGIIAVIAKDAFDLVMEEGAALEELPGQELIKLSGSLTGTRVSELSFGLIDDETLGVELWITPGSFELNRLVITDPMNPDEEVDTTWTMDFWNFGETADIQPPQ
jgi:hypothetical protein